MKPCSVLPVAVLASILGVGCTDWTFDLDECGRTCGEGPFYLVDQLEFVVETEDGALNGFDLDDNLNDCETEDGTAADGTPGIDNQFGAIWDVLPDAVATVLPVALEGSLRSGAMMMVVEVVAPDAEDGPVGLVLREGDGDVLVGAGGRPLSGQTIGLVGDENILGTAEFTDREDGTLHTSGLNLTMKLEYVDTQVSMPVVRGRGTFTPDGEGGLALELGGAVPLDDVMEVVAGLGGDGDANIRAALEALLPLLVDVRTREDGACDALSGAFRGHAVPIHLFEP